jgi:hypothetical protein
MINPYLTLTELQTSLGTSTYNAAGDYELAIESASRWIDDRCSDPARNVVRHFWREESPTARLYHACSRHLVRTGDFADTTGLVVEVDTAGDGVFTPLAATSWQPEPLVRVNGHPYTQLCATTYGPTFPLGLRPRVRVTARWGWAAVPGPVKQACQILAVSYLLGKDVISNEDGYSVGSMGPTNPIALAEHLLRPYLPEPAPLLAA